MAYVVLNNILYQLIGQRQTNNNYSNLYSYEQSLLRSNIIMKDIKEDNFLIFF